MQGLLPDDCFDRWATSGGPERFTLLSALRPQLAMEPPPPREVARAVKPLRWVLQKAKENQLPLDRQGSLQPDFAATANRELGFVSPARFEGERTFLEIDALVQLARCMGSTWPAGSSEELTDCGRIIISNPQIVWREAADCIGVVRPPSIAGEVWELIIAWLLHSEPTSEILTPAIKELAENHLITLADARENQPVFLEAIPMLYTLGRGLSLFEDHDGQEVTGVLDRPPILSKVGRATFTRSLRAAAMTRSHQRAPDL